MGDKHTRSIPARRTERRLVKMVGESLRGDHPNRERIGCPNSDAINAVIGRRTAFPDFDNIVDHIATCAPCFEEYNRQHHRYRLRNGGALALGYAVILTLGLLWKDGPPKPPQRNGPVSKEMSAPALSAALDYRNWTAERSDQTRSRSAESPHLTRAQLDLSIQLPFGTEDGVYTVQFRSNRDESVAQAVGSATWNGTSEVLKITIDLRGIPPGAYTVATISANSSVRLYPVFLE